MVRTKISSTYRRQSRFSPAEKAALLAKAEAPGMSLRRVALECGLSDTALYNWRRSIRQSAEPQTDQHRFIPYGAVDCEVEEQNSGAPIGVTLTPPAIRVPDTPVAKPPRSSEDSTNRPLRDELMAPHPGARPGAIEIMLSSGQRLVVDSYVNEKALYRVLRTLKAAT